MQKPLCIHLMGVVLLLQSGCQTPLTDVSEEASVELISQYGAVKGRACDPLTGCWLTDGAVYTYIYDEHDTIAESRFAYTDRNGFWLLDELPAGRWYDIYVQKGDYLGIWWAWLDGEETVDLSDNLDKYCCDSRGQVYDP